jgi:hypothetical protein
VDVRKRKLVLIVATAALLATGASAGARGDAVASAGGDYSFSGLTPTGTIVVEPFEFWVKLYADGSVKGKYRYEQNRDGSIISASGPLTCAVFQGSRLWVGGLIHESNRPALVGLDMWFQVHDRGQPDSETPDISTSLGAGGPGTGQQYCDDAPDMLFPFLVSEGFVRVSS